MKDFLKFICLVIYYTNLALQIITLHNYCIQSSEFLTLIILVSFIQSNHMTSNFTIITQQLICFIFNMQALDTTLSKEILEEILIQSLTQGIVMVSFNCAKMKM